MAPSDTTYKPEPAESGQATRSRSFGILPVSGNHSRCCPVACYGRAARRLGTTHSLAGLVTVQVIVCKNGVAGINFEHSTCDGHSVLRFASDVYARAVMP